MIANRHAKHARLVGHIAPNAAHAQDAEHFALRIVAERRQVGDVAFWAAGAAKRARAECLHRHVEVAEGTEDEKDGHVGGGVVDRGRRVGDTDVVGSACGDVDLVIASTYQKIF